MKTIKPQGLGLLCRSFENDGECYLVVSMLAMFAFDAPRELLPEVSLWQLVAREASGEEALDACMSKERGELLVTGRCYPPGGVARTASAVRVQLGAIDKKLYVVGDRRWGFTGASDPEPFTEVAVSWQNAFGGPGFAQNPVGKGFAPVKGEQGEVHALPNVEDPAHLLRSPRERPTPVGFGPLDLTWPQRMSKAGTYDAAWLEERFPGFAKDMDWSMFNTAPKDQQIEGYFRGDEAFTIENMHPTQQVQRSSLPGVRARCFLQQSGAEALREVATRLDTVRLYPHEERGVLVFRGMVKVAEDDASDVVNLVAGFEAMDAPKPAAHYETVLRQRLDTKRGHLYVLRDRDLMPEGAGVAKAPAHTAIGEVLHMEGLMKQRLRAKAEREMEEAREMVRGHGLDPALYVPASLPEETRSPTADDMPEVVDELLADEAKARDEAAAAEKEAEAKGREAAKAQGVDYDARVAEGRRGQGGPPKFTAASELEKLREMKQLATNAGTTLPDVDAKLGDPAFEAKLRETEEQLRREYVAGAHLRPAADAAAAEASAKLRAEVAAGHARGESFAGRDLTGVDLSGLDLRGLDLTGAFLEMANLAGCDLAEARLAGAVLARADLTGATLDEAQLGGANVGGATIVNASLRQADLTRAVLARAVLTGSIFEGASIEGADLSEATLKGADLQKVRAAGVTLIGADLDGVSCRGADLSGARFIESTLKGADFTGARLASATLVTVTGEGAIFRGANAANLRVVQGSKLDEADFAGAMLDGANLRGTTLAAADFTEASMRGADLSGCDLRGAKLDRAAAAGARFMKSDLTGATMTRLDLMEGMLTKAKIGGADLSDANLFRVDFAKVKGDDATRLDGANLKHVRVVMRSGHGQG